ncbi:HEPN domain-containing protein [Pedobacter alluvionis]|uniref:RiboL-PSP-HEPN domain-containing protein n=1 Tax=Pedobacter alluvionis TaxID=475253 RepID=A0A497XT53_9SPHI|nr:HEPN domain-containing protein [Pedobacter alluvionis]RLJ72509.1 hypothetical protein BCL90_4130 [Pedobacter alluvionis]TFB28169.1 hypothetical protein E3V97_24435 [Pedobacter alluvionis]
MNQTFINSRFEQIEKRFNEVQLLLDLAATSRHNLDTYQALCRSAHVLLVSHFEGLYKEICRDIIDDINMHTNFFEVKKVIFNSHSEYFINNKESEKSINAIKLKLFEAFKEYPSKLRVEPFLFVDNKNPAPEIIETILEKFGIKNFFWSIDGSDLDVVFEDQKSAIERQKTRLLSYLKIRTATYPFTVDRSFYNPIDKSNQSKKVTLWEDFLNNFLKERHNIIHGNTVNNPNDNESLSKAKIKIEILIYAFILNICSAANPIFMLSEAKS